MRNHLAVGVLMGVVAPFGLFAASPAIAADDAQVSVFHGIPDTTVDVFVNNALVAQRSVPPGPFSMTNIPTVTGGGNVELVVRGAAAGHPFTDIALVDVALVAADGSLLAVVADGSQLDLCAQKAMALLAAAPSPPPPPPPVASFWMGGFC